MSNVIQIQTAMTGADKAFLWLATNIKSTYEDIVVTLKRKLRNKKGELIRHDDIYDVCAAYWLIKLKEAMPDEYQLLCDEAGGEFEFVKQTLLN